MHWASLKRKLIANFHPKYNIVVHHVLLRRMLINGFNVAKIHKALQYDQKPYMKMFIDTFVGKSSEAEINVEKKIFKLILNSAFGNGLQPSVVLMHRKKKYNSIKKNIAPGSAIIEISKINSC